MSTNRCSGALHLFLLLGACSGSAAVHALPPGDGQLHADTDAYSLYLQLDQVSARVPRELAPIPAVAVARINIALHQAKQLAEQRLCAGRWTPQGSVMFEVGPLVSPADQAAPGSESWDYQSFRQPESLACGNVNRLIFFQEVSRHLPDWILIRPGGRATAFRQGTPVAAF